jgi:tetratricopeptide (TPR) repeat protein
MRQSIASCFAVVVTLSPVVASAQEASTEGESTAPSASPYALKVQQGIRATLGQDLDGAVAALREAVQLEPTRADAYYYMAEALRLQGNLEPALEGFRTGARLAATNGDAFHQARCMHGAAGTLERMEGRLAEARQVWTELAAFADGHREVANPEIARARIEAVDAVTQLAQSYIAVRERIAERERENAASSSE